MKKVKQEILKLLSPSIKCLIKDVGIDYSKLTEIRLRINEPLIFVFEDGEYFLCEKRNFTINRKIAYRVNAEDIRYALEMISEYSLYAYEDEVRQGFITICGGHRVGLMGQAVMDNKSIKSVKHISFINIRIAHQIKGCANEVLPFVYDDDRVLHTLIISPPGGGKTTLLRDMVRCISDGNAFCKGMNVGVVDERSEIAACYMGVPQNDVGIRTDILDACPKAEGMLMMLRSMNPKVIAVDEIGGREDIDVISYIINCGCSILATVHGYSIDDIRTRPVLRKLVEEKAFERYIVLDGRYGLRKSSTKNEERYNLVRNVDKADFKNGIGRVRNIFDERGNELLIKSYLHAN